MKVAVVGATGLVGTKMLQVLAERNFPVTELLPVASERSVGKEIEFKGKKYKVVSMTDAIAAKPAVALFSAGGGTSLEWAPKFAEAGITVIDNSSAWKMDDKKLADLLGVDAIVRMQVRKKRYMSDYASYGVTIARDVIRQTPLGNKLPIPRSLGKTEDIYAYCSVVSNSVTLWNNNYKAAADWDNPSNVIIENITDNFGRYFPYKKRR